jgi:hypothetical protein
MSLQSAFYPFPIVGGTTAGTYAAGNDSRITGAATKERAPTFRQFVAECNAKLAEYGIDPSLSDAQTAIHTGSTLPFDYNTNCWLPPSQFDFSGVSLHDRGGALITSRHVLFAEHYSPSIGDTVSFLRQDNTVASSTISKLMPAGFRRGAYRVEAVADNKLYLDGVWNNAGAVAVRKSGIGQVTNFYYVNSSGSVNYSNTLNEVSLFNVGPASLVGDLTQFTSLDNSYVGATVIFYEQAEPMIAELASAITGCTAYPILNPEFSQLPFEEENDLTIYGIVTVNSSGYKAFAKKFEIKNILGGNAGISRDSEADRLVDVEFSRITGFNENVGGPFVSELFPEGVIGGDSGCPAFVIDKNNQLILVGTNTAATSFRPIGVNISAIRDVIRLSINITTPWYQDDNPYLVRTLPDTVETTRKIIESGAVVDFDAFAQASARRVVRAMRSPNIISNQGSLININSGTGVPSSEVANGSLYIRTDGTADTTLYVRAGGSWTAIAST